MSETDLSRFTPETLVSLPTEALAELYEVARLDVTAPGAALVERAFGLRVKDFTGKAGGRLVCGEWCYSWSRHEAAIVRGPADLDAGPVQRGRRPEPVVPVVVSPCRGAKGRSRGPGGKLMRRAV